MDLGPAVASLSFDTLSVSRRSSSYNSQGVLVPGTPTTVSMVANVQPLNGKDLERVPEGQRANGGITVFTQAQLFISASTSQMSDFITFRGDVYDVIHSEQWDGYGYWRSVLVKREV